MHPQTQPNFPTWDAVELLEIISPDTGTFCCVGTTTKGWRCTKPIAKDNRHAAQLLLATLPQLCYDERRLRAALSKLAGFALCRGYHQCQITQTSNQWYSIVREALADEAEEPAPFDDFEEEIARLRRELEELQHRQAEQRRGAEDEERRREQVRREQEEARRRAEEEARRRAEEGAREEEARQRQEEARREEEEARQREEEARRAEEEASRRREEARQQREARQRAEAQARADRERNQRDRVSREWAESWTRYERGWERLDTSTLGEDIRESVPWPVKSGRWQDVTEANIRAFLRRAPDDASDNPRRFRLVLRGEAKRWHMDRLQHFFKRIADDEECSRLATLVMQVVNGLMGNLASL